MDILTVYLNETPVGELRRSETQLSFRYLDAYLLQSDAIPLSRHLPLPESQSATIFSDTATRAFFENLLPEAGVRQGIARTLGLSQENVFGLLEAVGGDCAGAVSVLPSGVELKQPGGYRKISHAELANELSTLPAHPFLVGDEGVRLSLAGAQNKLPIHFSGGDFAVPLDGAPSSHILKTAISGLENTVVNEVFCMELASLVGLPVPLATVAKIGDQQVYMVERYDRKWDETDHLLRIQQEDFCQALGIPPASKYEKEGGPGFADCFALVRSWSTEPLVDIGLLLRWALFNFLIGNADAHAKNVSFLYADGGVRLTPFYDLISTAVYDRQVDNKFAMKMGGQKDPRYLSSANLQKFAVEAGIGVRVVKSELQNLSKKMEEKIFLLADEYRQKYDSQVIVGRLLLVMSQRLSKAVQLQ